jgi:hypothetical protein
MISYTQSFNSIICLFFNIIKDNFGYNFDSISERKKIYKLYNAICNEYENVERMFSDCIEELSEIC